MASSTPVSSGTRKQGGPGENDGRETPMRQGTATALDDRLRDRLARVGSADLLGGIPSSNTAATAGHAARTVAAGLRTHSPASSPITANATGASKADTRDDVSGSTEGLPASTAAYVRPLSKGSAFRA